VAIAGIPLEVGGARHAILVSGQSKLPLAGAEFATDIREGVFGSKRWSFGRIF
jgi:hypothetical protein